MSIREFEIPEAARLRGRAEGERGDSRVSARGPCVRAFASAAAITAAIATGLITALGCGATPAPGIDLATLEQPVRAERFEWSDAGAPAPSFEATRRRCAETLLEDEFAAAQPPFNLAIMMVGCIEKAGWSQRRSAGARGGS